MGAGKSTGSAPSSLARATTTATYSQPGSSPAGHSNPQEPRQHALRQKPSERGGRSGGRLSGTTTTTPIVGVSPMAAPTPRPASSPPRCNAPYPVVPVTNLTAQVRVHPRSVGEDAPSAVELGQRLCSGLVLCLLHGQLCRRGRKKERTSSASSSGSSSGRKYPPTAELGSLDLAAQDGELVAQHRDLDILGTLASQAPEQHADESAGHEVEEGQGHRRIIP
jgi:hypothetical protein